MHGNSLSTSDLKEEKKELTCVLGKPKCILDESTVFLSLFESFNVYFSSCLVFILGSELGCVFAKNAQIEYKLQGSTRVGHRVLLIKL